MFILTFYESRFFDVLARPQLSVLIILVVVLSSLMIVPVRFPALPQPTSSCGARATRAVPARPCPTSSR